MEEEFFIEKVNATGKEKEICNLCKKRFELIEEIISVIMAYRKNRYEKTIYMKKVNWHLDCFEKDKSEFARRIKAKAILKGL